MSSTTTVTIPDPGYGLQIGDSYTFAGDKRRWMVLSTAGNQLTLQEDTRNRKERRAGAARIRAMKRST